MATRTRKPESTRIGDFIAGDARVVALEGFRPAGVSILIERGRYYRLSDEVVRQHPMYFAVLVPVNDVLDHEIIER